MLGRRLAAPGVALAVAAGAIGMTGTALAHAAAPPGGPTGADLVRQCGQKYPGEDQQGIFTVTLYDREGRMKRSEYLRFWKDYAGADGISDKMLLFTTFPPDARGSAFMRVAYAPELNRSVDQWIYLPLLKKIRRVTIRDPGDSFLNSNLTYADVSQRPIEADDHHYLGITTVEEVSFHVVESIPRERRPLYGKRVFWFLETDGECVTSRIDYYDTSGELLKDQFIKWQKIGGAWIWERVLVRSRVSESVSDFVLSDMQVNTGLDDELFTARSLERGPEMIQRYRPSE